MAPEKQKTSPVEVFLSMVMAFCVMQHSHAGKQPPEIVEQPERMVVFTTEYPLVLRCAATGDPSPTYRWLKDDRELDLSALYPRVSRAATAGDLTISVPLETDAGGYQCVAESRLGTALSDRTIVRLAYLESFPKCELREHSVPVGDPFVLPCIPPRTFPAPSLYWMVNETGRWEAVDQSDQRITVGPNGFLYFLNVQTADGGSRTVYRCAVQSLILRQIETGDHHIVLPGRSANEQHPPDILFYTASEILAIKGEDLKLTCIFSGNPAPDVTWTRSGNGGLPSDIVYTDNYRTVVVRNVTESDAGTYVCIGHNELTGSGVRTRSWPITVTVQSAPHWEEGWKPNPVSTLQNHTAVEFKCRGTGIPAPSITWYINGRKISSAGNETDHHMSFSPGQDRLTFFNVTRSFVVQCNVSNKHGYLYANAYMYLQGGDIRPTDIPPTEEPPYVGLSSCLYASTFRVCFVSAVICLLCWW